MKQTRFLSLHRARLSIPSATRLFAKFSSLVADCSPIQNRQMLEQESKKKKEISMFPKILKQSESQTEGFYQRFQFSLIERPCFSTLPALPILQRLYKTKPYLSANLNLWLIRLNCCGHNGQHINRAAYLSVLSFISHWRAAEWSRLSQASFHAVRP